MALSWKTEYEKTVPAEGFSNWEIFSIAEKACKKLEWEYLVVDEKTFTASTPPNWTLTEEVISIEVKEDKVIFKSQSESIDLYEAGRNKKNIEDTFYPLFKDIQSTIKIEELRADATVLKNESLAQIKSGSRVDSEKVSFGFAGHQITFFLLLLNAIWFGVMYIKGVDMKYPSPEDITKWGGNTKDLVASGEWWRLLSNLFVHIGIWSLLVNLFGLYFIGVMVESILGRIKFLIAYLCCGILGSLASLYFSGEGVTAGASGAIAGMYGVFIAFATTNYINKKFNWIWAAGLLLFAAFNIFTKGPLQIDRDANVFGLLAGIIIGYLFYFFHFKRNLARAGGTRITVEIMIIVIFLILFYIKSVKNDSPAFEKAIMKLNQIELKAMTQMQRLQMAENNQQASKMIKDSTLPQWKHFQKELDKTDKYSLDAKFKQKRKLLHDYAELRYRQTMLIYLSLKNETSKYDAAIDSVSNKIDTIIDEIGSD